MAQAPQRMIAGAMPPTSAPPVHTHNHAHSGATFRTAFMLTVVILLIEAVGGLLSHSLALLSDAGHMLTDLVALGLAWFATVQAGRPANERKTFGYHRIGILAALANAVTLIVVVGVIAFEALQRLQHPAPVTPWVMFVAAAAGIALNIYIVLGLRQHGTDNLNVRAALLHVLGDIGASAAVIVGGVIILLTGWYPTDPIISLLIAVLVAWSAWGLLRETFDILMEATPKNVNVAQLVVDMRRTPGILNVHDLHVWSIASGMQALSAHVQIQNQLVEECDTQLKALNDLLRDRYRITHTTIQFECVGCQPTNNLYCTLPQHAEDARAHQ